MSVLEPALYALGAVLYAAHFIRRQPALGRAATGALGAGVVVHTFLLGMATVRESALPLVGAGDALSGFVWLLAIVYLYVELSSGERAMGAFIAPFIAVLSLVAVASAQPGPRPAILDSPLFVFHVTFVLFAYASFAIAAVMGLTYVLLFRELKGRQPGVFYARLPSLAVLDQMNGRAIVSGFACLRFFDVSNCRCSLPGLGQLLAQLQQMLGQCLLFNPQILQSGFFRFGFLQAKFERL